MPVDTDNDIGIQAGDHVRGTRHRSPQLSPRSLSPCIEPEISLDSVILQSELHNHIIRREGESIDDYMRRYSDTMNAMIRRGVSILSGLLIANMVPSGSEPKMEGLLT
jgi:hypothetical protein